MKALASLYLLASGLVLVASGGVAQAAPSAGAPPSGLHPTDSVYYAPVMNMDRDGTFNQGRVLDVENWSTVDQGRVYMWPYRPDTDPVDPSNQRWDVLYVGGNQFEFISDNKRDGRQMCLARSDEWGLFDGELVYQYHCSGVESQLWYFDYENGVGNGPRLIRSVEDGRCLDVRDFSTSPGATVQVWSCSNQWNQLWDIF
jgi:hypothetical protein